MDYRGTVYDSHLQAGRFQKDRPAQIEAPPHGPRLVKGHKEIEGLAVNGEHRADLDEAREAGVDPEELFGERVVDPAVGGAGRLTQRQVGVGLEGKERI